jgi:CHASE3 domain sensor protein
MRKTVEPTESQMGDAGLISTERKVRVGFGFALACLVAIAVVSYLSVVRVNENRAWVEHTHEVLSNLESLLAATTDSETAERGYVITGDESYLEPYRLAVSGVDGRTKHRRALIADNAFNSSGSIRWRGS